MNGYTETNGTYAMIEVMALDHMFRLWSQIFDKRDRRPAQGEPNPVPASQTVISEMEAAPAACGC